MKKTARERALDAAWAVFGHGFTRDFFPQLLSDQGSSTSKLLREVVTAIETAVELDRKAEEAARAPS